MVIKIVKKKIYCKYCNKEKGDLLLGCSCEKKIKWNNPPARRNALY